MDFVGCVRAPQGKLPVQEKRHIFSLDLLCSLMRWQHAALALFLQPILFLLLRRNYRAGSRTALHSSKVLWAVIGKRCQCTGSGCLHEPASGRQGVWVRGGRSVRWGNHGHRLLLRKIGVCLIIQISLGCFFLFPSGIIKKKKGTKNRWTAWKAIADTGDTWASLGPLSFFPFSKQLYFSLQSLKKTCKSSACVLFGSQEGSGRMLSNMEDCCFCPCHLLAADPAQVTFFMLLFLLVSLSSCFNPLDRCSEASKARLKLKWKAQLYVIFKQSEETWNETPEPFTFIIEHHSQVSPRQTCSLCKLFCQLPVL